MIIHLLYIFINDEKYNNLSYILQAAGSARAQVFGDHDTVRAQGPLGLQLWAFLQTLVGVGSRHPDETRDTFTATGFRRRYPAAVLRDWVRKLGMGFCTAHPTLRSASVCVLYFIIFNYLIIPNGPQSISKFYILARI